MKTLAHLLETHTILVLAIAAIIVVAALAAGDAVGVALLGTPGSPDDPTVTVLAALRGP
jgi:uncharacterized protein (DUF58 family)